ncbi:hypothetical protein [Glycomyces dulcitolivorans]|uniref:hypothetical protein n=1 Tax=Glycomyces dulcitolivorans TaxID=2200759 RepID=UPI000DD4CD7B|nr:hypothetical protein [Glycomyces dulcitolivorans]
MFLLLFVGPPQRSDFFIGPPERPKSRVDESGAEAWCGVSGHAATGRGCDTACHRVIRVDWTSDRLIEKMVRLIR